MKKALNLILQNNETALRVKGGLKVNLSNHLEIINHPYKYQFPIYNLKKKQTLQLISLLQQKEISYNRIKDSMTWLDPYFSLFLYYQIIEIYLDKKKFYLPDLFESIFFNSQNNLFIRREKIDDITEQDPLTSGIELPAPNFKNSVFFINIKNRRTTRKHCQKSLLSSEKLSNLLCATFKQVDSSLPHFLFPRPGALDCVSVDVHIIRVDGVSEGLYKYSTKHNTLAALELPKALHNKLKEFYEYEWREQNYIPAVVIGLYHNSEQTYKKYGASGRRLTHICAGAILQTMQLLATNLNIAICPLGGNLTEVKSKTQSHILDIAIGEPFD